MTAKPPHLLVLGLLLAAAGGPAPRAQGDDAAYCAQLSALYRRYLGMSGEGQRFPDVAASVAMDDCARGNTAAGIPVLERKLTNARFALPKRT